MLKIFNRHGNGYFDVLASFIGGLVKHVNLRLDISYLDS